MVVIVLPDVYAFAEFVKRPEHVDIQEFSADASVQSFHIGVLGRLAWLYEGKRDLVLLAPGIHSVADKLWAIVHPDHLGESVRLFQLLQDAYDPLRGQGRVCFNA